MFTVLMLWELMVARLFNGFGKLRERTYVFEMVLVLCEVGGCYW